MKRSQTQRFLLSSWLMSFLLFCVHPERGVVPYTNPAHGRGTGGDCKELEAPDVVGLRACSDSMCRQPEPADPFPQHFSPAPHPSDLCKDTGLPHTRESTPLPVYLHVITLLFNRTFISLLEPWMKCHRGLWNPMSGTRATLGPRSPRPHPMGCLVVMGHLWGCCATAL